MTKSPKYSNLQLDLLKEFTRHIISLEAFYHLSENISEEMVNNDIEKLEKNYLNRIVEANEK